MLKKKDKEAEANTQTENAVAPEKKEEVNSSPQVTTAPSTYMESGSLGGKLSRKLHLKKVFPILIILAVVLAGLGYFGYHHYKSTHPDTLAKITGLSQKEVNNPLDLSGDKQVKYQQSNVQYWQDQNNCEQMDGAALNLAQTYYNSAQNDKALSTLNDVIAKCPGKAPQSAEFQKFVKQYPNK